MRTVIHWDGDRFFASIEQAADKRLRGRPVIVGGERRGVVLSASSEARRLGMKPVDASRTVYLNVPAASVTTPLPPPKK